MEWVLILTFYASTLPGRGAVAMISVGGFLQEVQCLKAGNEAKKLESTMKSVSFVCITRPA
jgi:hypothetical protein